MWKLIKSIVASKKFAAMVVGFIVAIAAKRGLNLDPNTINQLVGLFIAYIVGQGIADNGKEAAKVEAIAAVSSNSPASAAKQIDAIKSV